MIPVRAWAAHSASGPLAPWQLDRRDPGPRDVRIDILWCGVCHSDLHFVRGDWGPIAYPAVPGHEIVGRVVVTGSEVTDLAAGDLVAVGCLVDSCRTCPSCAAGLENYCDQGGTGTYMGVEQETGRPTYGGYSSGIVVDRHFVFRLPTGLDPASAAPLLCAGITTYSPLRHWQVGRGTRVGIVGLGGLGHMGVKLAAAMGAEVTVFTTSAGKERDAARLGASRVIRSREPDQMARTAESLDVIIDTVSAPHDLGPLFSALYRDGTLVLVGMPAVPHPPFSASQLINRRQSLAGSGIGGIPETREMLDFCAEHRIVADIEIIPMDHINEAWERMLRSDVKYRFVIDSSTLTP
jgi:alcohol dehydrogenase (NADP+)